MDASEAGVGNLEVAVNEGRVPSMAHALGQHRYDISFVPKENVDHNITVRFNNEPVPGSPFVCKLVTAAQASASGPGLERIPVDEATEIQIHSDSEYFYSTICQILVKSNFIIMHYAYKNSQCFFFHKLISMNSGFL